MHKMKAYKLILKAAKFQFPKSFSYRLPFTLLAQKREKHGLLRSYSDTQVIKFIVGKYYWSLHLNI